MDKEQIIREIKEHMESGKYAVADMSLFEGASDIVVDSRVVSHIEYTKELLHEYLDEITTLSQFNPGLNTFLTSLKNGDKIDNQSLERENSFLIGLYMQLKNETALEKLIKLYKNNRKLTSEQLYKIHETLLFGTSSEGKETVRKENLKVVGRMQNGERIIDYFPIDAKEVPGATTALVDIYNSRIDTPNFDNEFLQPFLVHGLTGALQIFNDGNTRMGRVMQHALIWQLINERTEFNFDLPPIYATRNYFPYRDKYRRLLKELVTVSGNESWNNWFDFNLDMIEDAIYTNHENANILKRKLGIK